ncbi:helix-turn-helix transcriptional regulator [Streptomyces sp. AA1529]|uniref:helix-turn-helix transcriptional regulator n=1 Tax=Streptomyces sp. AA1529 TaxID=1203257 RepID=UPI0002F5CFB7|nr:helix-turn-helix transcriptional regulator [Streptomyces sp. AA1529]
MTGPVPTSRRGPSKRPLSAHQLDALRLISLGKTQSHLAREFGIDSKSIGKLMTEVFRKLGATNAPNAVLLACRAGLLADVLDSPLTGRQHEALLWTARGCTAQEAADRMGVSLDTVRWLLRTAHHRLGARTATHAVALAMARGLITAGDITEPPHGRQSPAGAREAPEPHPNPQRPSSGHTATRTAPATTTPKETAA